MSNGLTDYQTPLLWKSGTLVFVDVYMKLFYKSIKQVLFALEILGFDLNVKLPKNLNQAADDGIFGDAFELALASITLFPTSRNFPLKVV